MSEKKKSAEDEFNAAPDAQAEFDAAPTVNAKEADNQSKSLNPTLGEHIADVIRRQRDQLPAKLRSAAMGLYNNAASIPEEVYKTIAEPDGQNPGWHTEHPEVRQKYMQDVKDQPGSNIAGAMLQPNPFGKASAATKLGKLGLATAKVGYAGAGGKLAQYLGQTEPTAQDSGLLDGAKLPMAIQAGSEAASPLFGRVAGGLRTAAGSAAANAAGLRGGIINQAKRAGIPALDAAGEEAIPKLGNEMLDEGLIPFMGSKAAVQKRAEKLMGEAGTAAEAIRTRADMAGPFDQALGVKAASARLGERVDPALGGNLQTARAGARAGEFITDAANSPNTFRAADDLKRGAYGNTNWGIEAPDAAKLKRQAVSGYRQSIEDQVDALLPGEGKALRDVNAKYGLGAQTADFAEEAATREAANQKVGWGGFMLGAAGAGAGAQFGSGGAAAGALLPVAAHFAKTRGASTAAPLLRLGEKATAATGKAVNQSPAAAAPFGNALENYLRPKDDEERQKEEADRFTSGTGR